MQTDIDTDIIKKSEANLNTILTHADSGYVLYNAELRIVAYNALAQKFAQLLYAKSLVEGQHLLCYFPEERHQVLLDITAKVLNGDKICYEMFFNIDGQEKWIEVRWLNVKNDENKNWGLILASKDITESKLAALKLEKVTQDLLQRNKALEQFANITSHNLRAPVANIINLVQMIDMVNSAAEKQQYLDYILLSSQALNGVIEDINKILEVKQHFYEVKEQVYFEQLLEDIKTTINYMIVKENVIITGDFEDAPYISSFRSFLYSIFYNIILNSIKYRKLGIAAEIGVAAKPRENKLVLTFKDNGKGIDLKKNESSLFGLYKRFDASVEGKGLGLFMIKSQIEELGGSITVESELGVGTKFIIELPV